MKTHLKQALLLGGFYFIVSFLLSFSESPILNTIDNGLFVALLATVLVLTFLKPLNSLENFQSKSPNISTYLISIGWAAYFPVFTFLFGIIYGLFNTSNPMPAVSDPVFDNAIKIIVVVYFAALIISLITATVIILMHSKKFRFPHKAKTK